MHVFRQLIATCLNPNSLSGFMEIVLYLGIPTSPEMASHSSSYICFDHKVLCSRRSQYNQ